MEQWDLACQELASRDDVMADLIAQHNHRRIQVGGQPFVTLINSIVSQQISVKAADAIWGRFKALCPKPTPRNVLALSLDDMRACGLSMRKAEYIHAVAEFFSSRRVGDAYWAKRTDEQVIAELTEIRGIGRWSAQMFLIFTLMRPNVFPEGDVGLLRALEKHYHGERLTPAVAKQLYGEQFAPWSSVATWFLWRSLEVVPSMDEQ